MSKLPDNLGPIAAKALILEMALTPKPGLVDPASNGAHRDMTYLTLLASIEALRPFLDAYYQAGWNHKGPVSALFTRVRHLGQKAEAAMLRATKGINTHKGANFSFAVILAASGYYCHQVQPEGPFTPRDFRLIQETIQAMTRDLIARDFQGLAHKTHLSYGERLYLKHGLTGIRGQAASGYALVFDHILPYFRDALAGGGDPQPVLLKTLLLIMANCEDSNLIHRGGIAAWKQVQKEAQQLFDSTQEPAQALRDYDQVLIQRHLSPGGAADLLAITFYFAFLEGLL